MIKRFIFIATLLLVFVTGCASVPRITNDYCAATHPILISKDDKLTDGTAKQILAANRTYAERCK